MQCKVAYDKQCKYLETLLLNNIFQYTQKFLQAHCFQSFLLVMYFKKICNLSSNIIDSKSFRKTSARFSLFFSIPLHSKCRVAVSMNIFQIWTYIQVFIAQLKQLTGSKWYCKCWSWNYFMLETLYVLSFVSSYCTVLLRLRRVSNS